MNENKTPATQEPEKLLNAVIVFDTLRASKKMNTLSLKVVLGLYIIESPNVSDLAPEFGVTIPAISRTIDALEKKGFVKRKRETKDRRRVSLCITSKGRDFVERILGFPK
jgi:DNA-binding MarR family transcriptional regulator